MTIASQFNANHCLFILLQMMDIYVLLIFFAPLGFVSCLDGQHRPVVSCEDDKKKIICLPKDYSKFDLPYRDEYNVIDIGN